MTRTEHDLLGERTLPTDALYGIHTLRALETFPVAGRPVAHALVHAFGHVKRACARTNHELGFFSDERAAAIDAAAAELALGALDAHVVVDALQGGAGTATNMNVNEVLANRALQLLGRPCGDYGTVHPLGHVNLHQSTNDTYPTALRVAAIAGVRALEREVVALQEAFQEKERAFTHIVKLGRTQLQDAVLTTLGRAFGAFAEPLSRDRWRIYKCEERLRVVNLGGTAIGTGLFAPRAYIFRVVDHLRELTGYGVARAENLVDATQNADVLVEVHGMLKAHAATLLKVARDLRLLASGPAGGLGEIRLPPRLAGSTIMPGKVNPVVPEAVCQAALAVLANDQAVATAVGLGDLELNAFLPLVADRLLDSLGLLTRSCALLRENCVVGIAADEARCRAHVENATAAVTALVETIGYEAAQELAVAAAASGRPVGALAVERGLMTAAQVAEATSPERVTRLGSPLRRPRPAAAREASQGAAPTGGSETGHDEEA
jgi:aspartate ammonia-lyase